MYGLRYATIGKGCNKEVYSCDKIQLVFRLRHKEAQTLLDALAAALWMEFDHWESRRFGTYRNQFSVKVDDSRSFWLGVGLTAYGKSVPDDSAKLEFNPNKVWPSRPLLWLLRELWARCKQVEPCRVKQWDLAVDYPYPREWYSLRKDGRLYEEHTASASDRTQYVGVRNAPGRCKLYNKAIEAGLDGPCTRLEITLAGDAGPREALAMWPRVYMLADVQTSVQIAALSDTDRFILATLLDAPDRINELGRRKRERMAALLAAMGYTVRFDADAFEPVRRFVAGFAVRPPADSGGLDVAAWDWVGYADGWTMPKTKSPF